MSYIIDRCPLCGSFESKPTAHSLYCECLNCRIVYQFKEIYQIEDYYNKIQSSPNCKNQLKSYRRYLNVVNKIIALKDKKNIVDVGAADGTFLNLVHNLYPDCSTFAIEHSEKAKTVLRQKKIAVIDFINLIEIKQKCVFLFQVLEHIAEPKKFIRSLNIVPGDFLILTSPAIDSVYFKRNKEYWRSYSPSYHLLLYNRQSLEYLLDKCDMTLIYYDFCYSRSNTYNMVTSYIQYIKSQLIWLASICVNGYSARPWYHGRSSYIAIAKNK